MLSRRPEEDLIDYEDDQELLVKINEEFQGNSQPVTKYIVATRNIESNGFCGWIDHNGFSGSQDNIIRNTHDRKATELTPVVGDRPRSHIIKPFFFRQVSKETNDSSPAAISFHRADSDFFRKKHQSTMMRTEYKGFMTSQDLAYNTNNDRLGLNITQDEKIRPFGSRVSIVARGPKAQSQNQIEIKRLPKSIAVEPQYSDINARMFNNTIKFETYFQDTAIIAPLRRTLDALPQHKISFNSQNSSEGIIKHRRGLSVIHLNGKGHYIREELKVSRDSSKKGPKSTANGNIMNHKHSLDLGSQSNISQSHLERKLNLRSVYRRATQSNSAENPSREYYGNQENFDIFKLRTSKQITSAKPSSNLERYLNYLKNSPTGLLRKTASKQYIARPNAFKRH